MSKRAVCGIAAIVIASLVRLAAIDALDPTARSALAIIVLAIVLWAADVLNAGITAILALGLLIFAGVPPPVALGGFATGAFWILICVLFFGTAMDRTGLARRIAYRILLACRPTYPGILVAFMLIGFVLTFGIPSMTVRTAIMVPIAFALVQAVGLPLPSAGAAVVVLGAFQMAVLPGCALLTGSLWGPFIVGLYTSAGIPIEWLAWAKVMAPPTVLWCALLVAANLVVMRPGRGVVMSKDVVRDEMRKLGSLGRDEVLTAFVVATSIVAWAAQPWHRIPPEAIGMVALAALFAAQVLKPDDIGSGIPWGLAIFVGGMLSLTTVMTTYKINTWLGGFILPAVRPFVDSPIAFAVALGLAVAAVRFVDPVGFITIAAFFLTLVGLGTERGVAPIALTGIILLPVHVFWFNYQNIWIVMTEGISKKRAYTDADRLKLATTFIVVTIAVLAMSTIYWRAIGVM